MTASEQTGTKCLLLRPFSYYRPGQLSELTRPFKYNNFHQVSSRFDYSGSFKSNEDYSVQKRPKKVPQNDMFSPFSMEFEPLRWT